MNFKNATVLIQLLFVIVVVAVLATHFRVLQVRELFESNIQGTVDKATIFEGQTVGFGRGHYYGDSKFPDASGNVVIQPGPVSSTDDAIPEIILNGKTTLTQDKSLCFKNGLNSDCYNSGRLSNVDKVSGLGQDINNLSATVTRNKSSLDSLSATVSSNRSAFDTLNNTVTGVNGLQATVGGLQSDVNTLKNAPRGGTTIGSAAPIYAQKTTGSGRGKCLDIPGWNTRNGTPIELYDCNETTNQKFQLTGNGQIKSIIGNKCIDVSDGVGKLNRGATVWRAPIQIWDCDTNNPNQKFTYDERSKAFRWNTKALGRNMCIDMPGGQTANGTKLILWECHGGDPQQFVM
jgi:hypothetical protein